MREWLELMGWPRRQGSRSVATRTPRGIPEMLISPVRMARLFITPTTLFTRSELPDTFRDLFQSHAMRKGMASNNKADGPIERTVSSISCVKSNVCIAGWSKKGPKVSSLALYVTLAMVGRVSPSKTCKHVQAVKAEVYTVTWHEVTEQ